MARQRKTGYAPAAQITERPAHDGLSLAGSLRRHRQRRRPRTLLDQERQPLGRVGAGRKLEEAGFLRSYRLPMPVFKELTDKNGRITNRLVEDTRRIWLLRGKGIKELRKSGADEYQSGTSPYNQAQRLAPQPANFAHEVFALWAAQSLAARLTDDEHVCRIKASEHQLRKQQAKADGKQGFYAFGAAATPGG